MENLKHTSGEWILNEERSEIVSENDCTRNGGIDIIAKCFVGFNYESTIDECKANAKLIASCPIMYNYILSKSKEGCEEAKKILLMLYR